MFADHTLKNLGKHLVLQQKHLEKLWLFYVTISFIQRHIWSKIGATFEQNFRIQFFFSFYFIRII